MANLPDFSVFFLSYQNTITKLDYRNYQKLYLKYFKLLYRRNLFTQIKFI